MTMLSPYQPPRLDPLTYTAVSKHLIADVSFGDQSALQQNCDVRELLGQFGSPLFVVSEEALRQLYKGFHSAFSMPGIDTRVAYSYKTNYLPAICAILHAEGAWAEVVSGAEYELTRALGVDPSGVIFNGPYKANDELEWALQDGAIVNIDNFDELKRIEDLAVHIRRPCRVGIRVNFKFGPSPWNKFGFNYESGEAAKALDRIGRNKALKFELLHNHSGTFQLNQEVYGRAVEVLIDLAKHARNAGLEPTMVDLGGGYPSGNRLKPEFDLPASQRRARNLLHPYGEAVLGKLLAAKELFGGKPTLVLEPGRALVDSAVQLFCSVVSTKTIPNQGKAVIVDAGVNLVPTAYWYEHQVDQVEEAGEEAGLESVSIYGPLCMQIDVLRENMMLPPLKLGDPVVVSNVGAYCHTQSMQFIQPRPATVLLGPDGPELIRKRESWRDFFVLDRMPNRLKPDGFAL